MGRTHDVLISEFDLDRLESQLAAAERAALRAERELERERVFADRLARYICDIHDVTSSRKVLKITTEACKTWWTHRKEARSE